MNRETDLLAGELRTAVNRLAFHLRQPATEQGLTPSRLTVLVTLDKHGPQRPGVVAAMLGVSAASMSRLTEALEEGGWVSRRADPDDRRAFLLQLTGHGREALERLRSTGTSRLSDEVAALSAQDRRALQRALPVLTALADRALDLPATPADHTPAG